MEEINLRLLQRLALKDDLSCITTASLSEKMNLSAKNLSKRLNQMEKKDLLNRKIYSRGQSIEITDKGLNKLRKEFRNYKKMLEETKKLVLKGEITKGCGEGQYYMGQPEYQKQFDKKLGFKPYPGTLNVKLAKKSVKKALYLIEKDGIKIEGFKKQGRFFGDVKCFKSKINSINSAIIFPDRSNYDVDIIEVISKYKLREKLDSKNVKITVSDN